MFAQVLSSALNGLSVGAAVFLVAAGLTLIFGILHILNFAHGAFFMIGAYVTYTLVGNQPNSSLSFLAAAIAAGLTVGVLGLVVDYAIFRRLQEKDIQYTLIASFALMLFCHGAATAIWGIGIHAASTPPGLSSVIQLGTAYLPTYSIAVFAAAVSIFLMLDTIIHRLWVGKLLVAVARDKIAAGIMGVNVRLMISGSTVCGFFLAGLAGGLLLPNQSLSPEVGDRFLLLAFNSVIIGGLGSIRGAFVAAMFLGMAESFSSLLLQDYPGLISYLALIICLIVRPEGLFPSEMH